MMSVSVRTPHSTPPSTTNASRTSHERIRRAASSSVAEAGTVHGAGVMTSWTRLDMRAGVLLSTASRPHRPTRALGGALSPFEPTHTWFFGGYIRRRPAPTERAGPGAGEVRMPRTFRHEPPEPSAAVVPRPRLLQSLLGRWEHPVTTVVGGAGMGKTTLLAQAVAENRLAPRGDDV